MISYYRNWPYLQVPIYGQPYVYPMSPGYVCPFYDNMATDYLNSLYEEDNGELEDGDMMRQRPQDVNRIMALINQQFNNYYTELQRYRIQRVVTRNIFRNVVTYVLRNENKYTGNIEQRTNAIFNAYQRDNAPTLAILRGFGVPSDRINQIIRAIIRFTLENIGEQPISGWSQWEDLGGVLTSGPAVASWQANRLDVFGRGQNNALWHKWWDGSRWSDWEDLGGVLTSAPAAVSWGPNRIDVFGRGQNNALWHKWWNGSSWSQWEDLGGVLTSDPAVASWQANRLDVFGRGQNNALWHKWWDGSRWSDWEDLGGVLTSAPAAVSWGPNRIDVFGRGQNNSLWHKWWNGSSWSQWEDLGGGAISSAPAAASTAPNRLEVFARGGNNQLLFRTWDGTRWSGWQSLGGELTSQPAAVSWGGNRLDVFAKGQNNHLWHIWRP
ncbi:hypothetical protein HNQ80_000337 [Anaerosolibacter carboniphilus]|uniref:PLL-like beta propeller domain-containing protein n=1 Tax=Anaerosolibacter carboniphilus TaxID=1417629 RepID=A0A841KQ76_9FIRM|nr:hypothetical protein [Anaerosolibacter carboniphilus]